MPQASTVEFLEENLRCSPEEVAVLSEYADKSILTLRILLETFKAKPEFVKDFLRYAQAANLTLDAYLLTYTKEQREIIIADFKRIYKIAFANTKREEHPVYFATAGAPGVCHPELLHQKFNVNTVGEVRLPENAIYLAPDDFYMPQMELYKDSLAASDRITAYKVARYGSNWGTNVMHAAAALKKRNIIHDTTSSSPICKTIYKALEKEGYQIQLALIFASNEFMADTLRAYIEKHGPIVNADEALKKLADVIARMQDTYFDLPTIVDFFWAEKASLAQQPTFKNFAHYDKRNVPYLDEDGPAYSDQEPGFDWKDPSSLTSKPRMRSRNLEIDRTNSNYYGYMIRLVREFVPPNDDASRCKAAVSSQLLQWLHTPNPTPNTSPTGSPRRGSPRAANASPLLLYLNGLAAATAPPLVLPASRVGTQAAEGTTPISPAPG